MAYRSRKHMPFYEYECTNCRYYTEVLQKISDEPLKKCPSCGKKTFKKLVSAPVFRLKGSGWYETDFKSDQERKRNLAGAEREESSSSAGKSDAKPTTGGDAKTPAGAADTKAQGKTEGKSSAEPKSESKSAATSSGDAGGVARRSTAKSSKAGSGRGAAAKKRAGKSSKPAKRRGSR